MPRNAEQVLNESAADPRITVRLADVRERVEQWHEKFFSEVKDQIGEIIEKIKQLNKDVDTLAAAIMEQVYQSQDEVSKTLAPIFASAIAHTPAELQRAKERRERGNPPGKRPILQLQLQRDGRGVP